MISCDIRKLLCVLLGGASLILFLGAMSVSSADRAALADDVPDLIFSHESGFYDAAFFLSISAAEGEIYYTLDGSDPDRTSLHYTSPIPIGDASGQENVYAARTDVSTGFYEDLIAEYSVSSPPGYHAPDDPVDKCTIVRAVLYWGNGKYSPVKTGSYFVGFDQKSGYENINILSIVTDPDHLFDAEEGIYVTGKVFAEYLPTLKSGGDPFWQDYWHWWQGNYRIQGIAGERPADIQFFDSTHTLRLSQTCGIRIRGGGSRGFNPKSLNLYARSSYDGHDHFSFAFWDDAYYASDLTLFSGGDDVLSKSQDYLMHTLTSDLSFATIRFLPSALFLDGEYWGVYWLTEKYDENYIQHHYGVESDNVLIIKNDEVDVGETDDYALYHEAMDFCGHEDLSKEERFAIASEYLDMESTIDYFAAMLYIARHGDWPGSNTALWRSRKTDSDPYSDGKWRWMLFDVNSGGMTAPEASIDTIEITSGNELFHNLMQNDWFREALLDRILDLEQTSFSEANVEAAFTSFSAQMSEEVLKKNYERFYGHTADAPYMDKLESVRSFFPERRKYIRAIVEAHRRSE